MDKGETDTNTQIHKYIILWSLSGKVEKTETHKNPEASSVFIVSSSIATKRNDTKIHILKNIKCKLFPVCQECNLSKNIAIFLQKHIKCIKELFQVCQECGDEFCGGECATYQYSHFEVLFIIISKLCCVCLYLSLFFCFDICSTFKSLQSEVKFYSKP